MTPYVVEYCFCAIPFLLVILWNSLTTRQFPGFAHRVFRVMLVCALVDVIMDVIGAYTIPLALELPPWINYVINTVYYMLQMAIPALLVLYVYALEGFRLRSVPLWVFAPVALGELVVLTNPLHDLMFHIDPVLGYQRGLFFSWMFAVCLLYILMALAVLHLHRKRVNRKQYVTITLFIAIVIGAVAIQFLCPTLLLSGPAIALSSTMLYLTIQKPDDMLDVTTGVFNRTALMQMVDNYVAEKQAFQATLLVLKHVSPLDRIMGYESLNRLMAEIGRFLTGAFPRSWAFRLSGSTLFVVLTRKPADYETGLKRLRERFQKSWLPNEYDIILQVSILRMPHGEMVRSADEFSRLINYAADLAPEEAELELGEAALAEINRRAEVENALTAALDEDLFEVYIQPIYNVRDKTFTHAEALLRLRWRDEMIPPAEFIPVAEQNGLILRLDALVLRKVCEFLRACDERGEIAPRCVSVNLSAVEFLRPDFAQSALRALAESGVSADRIAFEMTETAASGPLVETREQIERIRADGSLFILDDFGTGFANITQVVQLPFDIAKLDRSIVAGAGDGESGVAVLRSSISMFKELGVRVVAEGAETAEVVDSLTRLDVDFIQGYYYARPMPMDEARAFFATAAKR